VIKAWFVVFIASKATKKDEWKLGFGLELDVWCCDVVAAFRGEF